MRRLPPRGWAALQALFVTFLWATSWVLIKIGLRDIPSLTFAGLRYGLASAILLAIGWRAGQLAPLRRAPGRLWWRLVALGLIYYAVTQGAMFVSLDLLPAITTNLILSFSPAAVALLAGALLAEPTRPVQWAGLVLAAAGAIVYFSPAAAQGPVSVAGLVAAAIALAANAGSGLLGRAVNRAERLSPLAVTAVSMTVGALALLAVGIGLQGLPAIPPLGWAIVAWLAVVNTAFAFTLWNHTLRTLSAVESSVINNTMIIHIPVLSVLFLGETLGWRGAAGLALVGLGALIVQLGGRPPRPARLAGDSWPPAGNAANTRRTPMDSARAP